MWSVYWTIVIASLAGWLTIGNSADLDSPTDLNWVADNQCIVTTDFLTTAIQTPDLSTYQPELTKLVGRLATAFSGLYRHPTCNGSFHLAGSVRQCYYVGGLPGLDELLDNNKRRNLDKMHGNVMFGDILVLGNRSQSTNELKFYNKRLSSLKIGHRMLGQLLTRLNSTYKLDTAVLRRKPSVNRGSGWSLKLHLVKKGNLFSFEPMEMSQPTVCKCQIGHFLNSMMEAAEHGLCHLWGSFTDLSNLLTPLTDHQSTYFVSDNHRLVKMYEQAVLDNQVLWMAYTGLGPIKLGFSVAKPSNITRNVRSALVHFSQFMASFGPECSAGDRQTRSIFDFFGGGQFDNINTNQGILTADIKRLNENQNSLVKELKEYHIYSKAIAGAEKDLVKDNYLASLEIGQNLIAIQLVGQHLESANSQNSIILAAKFYFDQLMNIARQTEEELADLTGRLAGTQLHCVTVQRGRSGKSVIQCSAGTSGITLQGGKLMLHSSTVNHRINKCNLFRCFPQVGNESTLLINVLNGIFISDKNSTHLFPLNHSLSVVNGACLKTGAIKLNECMNSFNSTESCHFIPVAGQVVMKCVSVVVARTSRADKSRVIKPGRIVYWQESDFPIFLNDTKMQFTEVVSSYHSQLPAVQTFRAMTRTVHAIDTHFHRTRLRLPGNDRFDEDFEIGKVNPILLPVEEPWFISVLSIIGTVVLVFLVLFATKMICAAAGKSIICLDNCFHCLGQCCCCCCHRTPARMGNHDIPLNNLAVQQQPAGVAEHPPPSYNASLLGSSRNSLAENPGGVCLSAAGAAADVGEWHALLAGARQIAARRGLPAAGEALDALEGCSVLLEPAQDGRAAKGQP